MRSSHYFIGFSLLIITEIFSSSAISDGILKIFKFFLHSFFIAVNLLTDRPEIYVEDAEIPQLDGRIVGGWPVNISSHPWQISWQNWHSHSCGGSLISPYWIVTAAHCISVGLHRYTIRLGTSLWQEGGILQQSAQVIRHPQFDSRTLDYDIALIKLSIPQETVENSIGYVQLPPENWIPRSGKIATVTGWGTPVFGGNLMNELQEVTVPIVSNEVCYEFYQSWLNTSNINFTDRMLCAGFVDGERDACQGDSGGPLIVDNFLTGIVSWGNGCAFAGFPGVYSSVPNLLPWIREQTGLKISFQNI